MKNELGFTLTEALVVITLMGVVGAVVTPGIVTWTRSFQLRGTVATLYADIHAARVRTIKDKVRHSVRMDGANKRWQLYHVGPNGTNENGGGDDVVIRTQPMTDSAPTVACGLGTAPSSVTGTSVSGPDYTTFGTNSRITFNSMGQCNAGFFYITNGNGEAMAVGTLSSGMVRTRKWNGAAWE